MEGRCYRFDGLKWVGRWSLTWEGGREGLELVAGMVYVHVHVFDSVSIFFEEDEFLLLEFLWSSTRECRGGSGV